MMRIYINTTARLGTISEQERNSEKQYDGNEECKPSHQEKDSSPHSRERELVLRQGKGCLASQGVAR